MQCLILAGGLGTRMRSLTGDSPKALLPVGTKTFIDWQLRWLKLQGVDEAVLALAHGSDEITKHLDKVAGSSDYPKIRYSFDGPSLLGTGGAIRNALPLLEKDFLVTYGDSFVLLNIRRLMDQHLSSECALTLSIIKNEDAGDKSNVVFENGVFIYDKKNKSPAMKYIDYGISALNRQRFEALSEELVKKQSAFDFADYIGLTCRLNTAKPFIADQMFKEIGSREGYSGFRDFISSFDFDLKKILKTI